MSTYTPYLTDTDRAIDRDTNEMLSPRGGYSGASYLAQGYANMDVLPEQLALADMLQRRQSLSMHSRQGRREQRDEDMLAAEQDEFDGYSGFVKGTAGMNEVDRAAAFRDRALNNPSELSNPLINKSRVVVAAGDKAVLEAKHNTLESKRVELGMMGTQYDINTFDQQAKLKDEEFANARMQASLVKEQLEESVFQTRGKNVSSVGEHIFNLNPFGDSEEGKETRNKLIKTIALLPKDTKEDRDAIRSLRDISGGLAIGRQVKQLKSYADINHRDLIRSMQGPAHKINLLDLPKDRLERDAFIKKAHDSLVAKGGDVASFTSYIEKVKGYNDTEDAVNQLTSDFTQSIVKIEQLSKSTDRAAKTELAGEMALLKAKASAQASYFDRAYKFEKEQQDVREKASEIAKRDADTIAKAKSGTLSEKRLAQAQYVQNYTEKRNSEKDAFDFMKEAADVKDKQMEESFGLDSNATVEQIMAAMKKALPSQAQGLAPKGI